MEKEKYIEYAKKMLYADVWNTKLDDETLTEF